MGIDIEALSQVRRVGSKHSEETCDNDEHIIVGPNRKLLDGLKSGCYLCDGKRFDFYVNYGGFETWQNAVSLIVLGVPISDVLTNPRRFKGQPFVELIDFPDGNDVGIGPKTSGKLHEDFAKHSARVKKGFQQIAAEAAAQRASGKKRKAAAKPKSYTAKIAASVAKALGGLVVGGDDDPASSAWEWKWELYRDFRKAFKLASDDGIVILSI